MKQPIPIRTELSQAEHTLRLVAQLPAPQGLEARLRQQLQAAPAASRILSWPAVRRRAEWRRSAAAAALVAAICGGSWAVYAHVQPSQSLRAVELPRVNGASGFSSAGAMRTPQTLAPAAAPQAAQPDGKSATKNKPAAPARR